MMKPKVGGLRLRLSESAESHLAKTFRVSDATIGRIGPLQLAEAIASHTIATLVEGEMLDPGAIPQLLQAYGTYLSQEQRAHDCILRFLLPDEGKLAMTVNWLNNRARFHVWEMAHRITPPKAFYKAHPKILDACKLCGAAILDAGTHATLTTGSISPLAGDFLANWIQSALEIDAAETHPRFFFHVVIPPRHWDAIVQGHFRIEYGA